MRMVIEQAGAQRGLLILVRDEDQRIRAEATTFGDTIVVRLKEALVTEDAVPQSIIRYVTRTRESVILDDALTRHPFSTDSYVRQQHARSILCMPLVNQAKLIGLLYLENNLSPNVFTPVRIATLNLLASQAAISLENTRLYRDLEEREAKIRRLVDANIVGILIWNLEGRIIEANEAFLQMVGHSREDLISGHLRWTDLTPPEWRERDERAIADLQEIGIFQPFEKEYFRKEGSRVPVLVGGAILEGSENEGIAFVLDLSEQKRAEEALRQSEIHLAEAQSELAHITRVTALGELTTSIAHEINQPLGAITNNANASLRFLATGSESLEEVKGALFDIIKGVDRVTSIIARIRALAKKAPPEMTPLHMVDVIADILTLIHHELARRHIKIEREIAEDLPAVIGDRVQLQQVLLNLVMNGVEAMNEIAEENRTMSIAARYFEQNGRPAVLISVQDSGVGLKKVNVDQLFEPFYTTKAQGLGMGLAISRSIIEAHDGRLWVAQTPGPGATFEFTLPASVPSRR
jgi:PAS domain S-box-containing protein